LASSFGDDPFGGDRTGGTEPPGAASAQVEATPISAAQEKFLSCRWRRAAEPGGVDCCGHRDVLPMAGTTGFQAEAWCTECAFYKAKRAPRKREEPRAPGLDDYWRR
jgi:hypothetical protein